MLYGTFSVDFLGWRRPHKCVMAIGLLACLISANQSFAWPRQQLTIFVVWESIVHNCLSQKPFFLIFSSKANDDIFQITYHYLN